MIAAMVRYKYDVAHSRHIYDLVEANSARGSGITSRT